MRYFLIGADGAARSASSGPQDGWDGWVPLPDDDPVAIAYDAQQAKPVPPASCTRLGLKRALDERGLWPTVKAMIASNDAMQEEWDLATELKASDPIVQKAIAGLAQLGTALTPDDLASLMIRANALVS